MRIKIMLVAGACLLMTGCGGADDSATAENTATSAPVSPVAAPKEAASKETAPAADDDLKAAVQAYSDAFLTGDGKAAYGLLSKRCRDRTPSEQFTGLVEAAGQTYGSALPFKTYSASVSGDLARVTYTYSIKAINQDSEPWVREGGHWHEDDC